MEKVLQTVEGLIRRSIGPSVTLFVMAGLVDLLLVELTNGSATARLKGGLAFLKTDLGGVGNISFAFVAILVIGTSYGLAMVQQVLFDNWLRKDFDPLPTWEWVQKLRAKNSEGLALAELRGKVATRLGEEPGLSRLCDLEAASDYVYYEILGGIDPTDTRHFVDSAKSLGITSISLIFALLGGLFVHWPSLCGWGRFVLFFMALGVLVLGYTAIRAQFRTRAIRLYVNFLAMPAERIQRLLLNPETGSPKNTSKNETNGQDGSS